jgi:hypothetical protein
MIIRDMRQASQIFKINTYYSGKLKQAEKIKDKLMDNIHGMTHLRYDKGTRDGDYALREKLKDLMQETEKYYKMIRAFGGGKIGDTDVFREILTFYGGQYLDSFPLVNCLDRLKFEIVNQENRDREHNIKKAGRKYVRRKNLYAKNFERDLNEWEMILLQKTVPLFAAFINELNDLVLFVRINSILDSLIIGDNTFALRGDVFGDFKIYIAMFIGYYIKNRKIYLSDREIRELICRTLDDMGFMDIILNTKNIRQEKFNELVDQQ